MSNVVHNNDNIWIGKKFGRLTVIGFEKSKKHTKWNWKCKCDCGNVRVVDPAAVKKGNTRSCGCLHDEECAKRATKFKHSIYEYKRLHGIYHGIKRRCYRVSEPRYKDYGGRGIKMCDEWLDKNNGFDNFVEWALSHGYTDKLTIERNDVNGNYCPENCRWATYKEQSLNTSVNRFVEIDGESRTVEQWCCLLGVVTPSTVYRRVRKAGWSFQKAITSKVAERLASRRLMYWSVYLHKTAVAYEKVLINLLTRAKQLAQQGKDIFAPPQLRFFLYNNVESKDFTLGSEALRNYELLDDNDLWSSIKVWAQNDDKILSILAGDMINRNIFKVEIHENHIDEETISALQNKLAEEAGVSIEEAQYLFSVSRIQKDMYDVNDDQISILYKDGTIKDITDASDLLNVSLLSKKIRKYYLCYQRF